jgi:hypothetical protein
VPHPSTMVLNTPDLLRLASVGVGSSPSLAIDDSRGAGGKAPDAHVTPDDTHFVPTVPFGSTLEIQQQACNQVEMSCDTHGFVLSVCYACNKKKPKGTEDDDVTLCVFIGF